MSAWLWPIGLGGRMPVGGDVTQFSLGLMAVLGQALKANRLPWWNDLWGFGFPGLAESQMGVFYPPHAIAYRWLSAEAAYTLSLVGHTYWAAWGCYWACRCFKLSRWASALAAISWTCSGVFLIHLPHQWGYTAGSWMPWALGIAYRLVRSDGTTRMRWSLLLSAALTLQVLPGHFQFAFMTQVAVIATSLWVLLERPDGLRRAVSRSGLILASMIGMIVMAAAQLVPSAELARSAQSQRTVEYLGAFPASPVHLINYVAPNLFHLSPLWRSLVWDPFHAMPEEHRPYIGLASLFLAWLAVSRTLRTDRETRLLTAMTLGSLLLSLGPYVPGFRYLVLIPGFSFFRAPARWSLFTTLGLAILAGKGFDGFSSYPRAVRSLIRFLALVGIFIGLVVLSVVLLLKSGDVPMIRAPFEAGMRWLPWTGDPSLSAILASAHSPPRDSLVVTKLIQQGVEPSAISGISLSKDLATILKSELDATLLLLLLLVLSIPVFRGRHDRLPVVLFVLTVADLWLLSRHRPLEVAPIRPLTQQSALIDRLSKLPRGARSLDPFRNLPMLVGVAPLSAYRTLDRPAMTWSVAMASAYGADPNSPRIREAVRLVGASVRVFDVFERGIIAGESINDPVLASWLYGEWARRHPEQSQFRIYNVEGPHTRAWFLPGITRDELRSDAIVPMLQHMKQAIPLLDRSPDPEHFEILGDASSKGTVVVSVLHDDRWMTDSGSPFRVFGTPGGGAWQGVEIAKAGPIDLRFRFEPNRLGLWISCVSCPVWALAGLLLMIRRRRTRKLQSPI